MKKLAVCALLAAASIGSIRYLNKNGLPIPGNLTMHLPVKFRYDFWDVFTKGIEVAEGFTK